jgi:hypothetical protein
MGWIIHRARLTHESSAPIEARKDKAAISNVKNSTAPLEDGRPTPGHGIIAWDRIKVLKFHFYITALPQSQVNHPSSLQK